jgi:hypothetical protein
MYSNGFILRMIEMIGDLIAGILGMIKKGEFKLASQTLENAYFNFLNEDASFFRKIKKEKLTQELIEKYNYIDGHLEILSELFYAEAELLNARNSKKESAEFYEKSFILLDYAIKNSKSFSFEKQTKLTLLRNRLDQSKDLNSNCIIE